MIGPAIFLALAIAAAPAEPVIENQSPVVSPDGSRIAFLSNRDGQPDVYVMRADGTNVTRLTRSAEQESATYWSADSRQIRFVVGGKDSSRIDSIDADGSNQTTIGTVPGRVVGFNRGGTRVFVARGTWTEVTLLLTDLDGSHPKQLTDGSSVIWNPKWSPDGKVIAYTGRDASGILHIYIMDADGANPRQLTHIESSEGQGQCPVWSPDGRRLAIQTTRKDGPGHVWIVDYPSGTAHKLAAHETTFEDELPFWFPDGKRLAFQSNRSGRMEVWTMNADGTHLQQLTGPPASAAVH
jgi:TolB protein